MFCFQCGTQLPDGAKFCVQCGTRLDIAPVAAEKSDEEIIVSPVVPVAESDDFDDFDIPAPITLPGQNLDASTIIEMILDRAFISIQKSNEYHEYFHPCDNFKDSSEKRQYSKIRVIYRDAEKQGQKFLFFYDNTFTRNCKESFLMTDRGIHFTSDRYQSGFIAYKDIKDMMIVQIKLFSNLIINDSITIPLRFFTDGCDEFCDDMLNIVIPLLMNLN